MEREPNHDESPALHELAFIPATVVNATHAVTVERTEQGDLSISIAKGEHQLFSALVTSEDQVHVIFQSRQVPSSAMHRPEPVLSAPDFPPPQQDTKPAPENESKPVRLVGQIKTTGTLEKTQKQQRPVYRFQINDVEHKTTRRIVAFDEIATKLSEQASLTPNQPIKMLAWRHANTVHVSGQKREIEEWYPQKIWYKDQVIEKPKQQRRR